MTQVLTQKTPNFPFIISVVFSTLTFLGSALAAYTSYTTAISQMDKRLEVLQTKYDFYVSSVVDLKKELKDARDASQRQLDKVSDSVDDVKSALLTNRKLDEIRNMILGAGKLNGFEGSTDSNGNFTTEKR